MNIHETEPVAPHLPGSVPLADAASVFEWAARELGPEIRRIPDGETGSRKLWIIDQRHLFEESSAFERAPLAPEMPPIFTKFRLRPGASPEFGAFDYVEAAKSSFDTFSRMQADGVVPALARFMVALPHPVDPVHAFIETDSFASVYEAYQQRTHAVVEELVAAIPHERLSIQWDLPTATSAYSGTTGNPFGPFVFEEAEMLASVIRVANWVPDGVELGFHLCFGDASTKPGNPFNLEQPAAGPVAADLVRLVNDIVAGVGRPVDFVHLPTQSGWLEEDAFSALADLRVNSAETDMSVGTINLRRDADQGLEAAIARARQRTAAVRAVVGPVGLSTSCGLGRHEPEEFEAVAGLYRELSGGAGWASSNPR